MSIRLYPNPVTNGNFQIELSSAETNPLLQLYDVNGRKMLEQKLTTASTTFTSALSAGIYFYQLKSATNGSVSMGKLVIQ
jgi:hypothetical protein